jgi:DNA invertase Pin-like site-specific DNA recombinase
VAKPQRGGAISQRCGIATEGESEAAPPLRAVGYIRVSTEEQARDGVSLEAQSERLKGYAGLYGITLVSVLADRGASAKTLVRPGLAEALLMLDSRQADALLVAKLDRLTRSVRDLGELLERYFSRHILLSVNDSIDTRTAAGRLTLNVLMSVAQWEREAIVERTKEAMAHKRTKGERLGQIPYGWHLARDGRRLVEVIEEQSAIEAMHQLRATGCSLRKIAAWLTAHHVATKRGGDWYASAVKSILERRIPGDGRP